VQRTVTDCSANFKYAFCSCKMNIMLHHLQRIEIHDRYFVLPGIREYIREQFRSAVHPLNIFKYIERMNSGPELFPDVLSYAREYKVPIMDFDALQVMKHYIHLTGAERILEIGTAIGYSALH